MKKIIAAVLLLLLAIGLTQCVMADPSAPPSAAGETMAPTVTVPATTALQTYETEATEPTAVATESGATLSPEAPTEDTAATDRLQPAAVVLVSNRLAKQNEDDAVWKQNAQHILDQIPDIPFGIYECPYPYKRLMSPSLLKWCAETGRFYFLKDTCCDLQGIGAKLAAVNGTSLKIFNANSATCLESLRMGCAGFCGVMLNFHPELYGWLCKNWAHGGDTAAALQNFATVASLIELQMYPVNAKYHLHLDGVDIGLTTRSKPFQEFRELQKAETKALYDLWKSFRKSTFPA